jgi:hypothetical protein
MSSLSTAPLPNDILSQLTGSSYPVSSPSSFSSTEWQNPLPAVTLGSDYQLDSQMETSPLYGVDDFLNAPTDLSFPDLFQLAGDPIAFGQAMDRYANLRSLRL